MRNLFIYTVMIGLGVVLSLGAAMLVGIVFPQARIPVFFVCCAWWVWIGWRYASMRDQLARRKGGE